MKESERTCCICRAKGPKHSLTRVVAHNDELVIDVDQRFPGRGAYLHSSVDCVSRGAQVGRWERALRLRSGSLNARQVSSVFMEMMTRAHRLVETP